MHTQKTVGCTNHAVFKLIYLLANMKDILLFPNNIFFELKKIINIHQLMVEDTSMLFSELTLVPINLTFKCLSICSIKMPDKVFELV